MTYLIAGIGVSSLGHRHPRVEAAVRKQIGKYWHTMVYGEYVLTPQVRLATLLAQNLPGLDAAYFTNGRRRVEWLENWAQRQKLAGETIPKDASEFLRHGFRSFELGAEEEAWKFFFTALEKDPQNAKSIINRARQLHDEGRSEAAQQLVNRLGRVVISREVKSAIDQTSALFRQDLTPAR